MTAQETIAHLQSQLDECRKERAELREMNENQADIIRDTATPANERELRMLNELTELRAQVGELQKDKERLDAIPHGWRIGYEGGAAGHPDHWYIWTGDWSQPLGEGETLRAAIDHARAQRPAQEGSDKP